MGRPRKYDEEFLIQEIYRVALSHPEKITFSLLERETGIKRHIWKDGTYKSIGTIIQRINMDDNVKTIQKVAKVQIPNLLKELINCEDRELLITIGNRYMRLQEKMLEIIVDLDNTNRKLSKELLFFERENSQIKDLIKTYEKQIASMYVNASIETIRRDNNLQPNDKVVGDLKRFSTVSNEELTKLFEEFL